MENYSIPSYTMPKGFTSKNKDGRKVKISGEDTSVTISTISAYSPHWEAVRGSGVTFTTYDGRRIEPAVVGHRYSVDMTCYAAELNEIKVLKDILFSGKEIQLESEEYYGKVTCDSLQPVCIASGANGTYYSISFNLTAVETEKLDGLL